MKLAEFLYPNRNVNDLIKVKSSKDSSILYEGFSNNIERHEKYLLNLELGIWKIEDRVFTVYVKNQ